MEMRSTAFAAIFEKLCTDFQAQLIEMDRRDNRVHLLMNYPPSIPYLPW